MGSFTTSTHSMRARCSSPLPRPGGNEQRSTSRCNGTPPRKTIMIGLHSLLCPVDFSTQSGHALRWARALARRTKGRLTVLNAIDPLLAEAATLRFGLDLVHAETEPA